MKEQKWLEDGWFFHNHSWHLLHEIIKKIPRNKKLKLLDFGGGTGIAAAIIHAVLPDVEPYIMDIAKESLPFWEKRKLEGEIIDNDLYRLYLYTPDNSFDIVISSHVLEHINRPESFINELFRICKDRLIIAVPDGDVHFYDHKIIFNREELKKRIEMSKIKYKSIEMFPVYHNHINNLIVVIDK